MLIGYARTSTKSESLEAQIDALKKAGCEKIFGGQFSGASPKSDDELAELVDYIREGDVVIVTRLDRLGRSLRSIVNTIDEITKKDAQLRTLDGQLDTTKKTPIAKAMIALLAMFAQLERDLIVERTTEGQARAKAQGKHIGRPSVLSDEDIKQIKKRLKKGASVSELAREFDVSRPTISKHKEVK